MMQHRAWSARPAPVRRARTPQAGAALLLAMMTVALVATIAAGALWQQWRSVEIEARERQRLQASWILVGALDWARLILSEDGRTGGADHLAEPWSIGLQEARLSTFLAIDRDNTDLGDDAFLSGQITDAQAQLNLANLVIGNRVSEPDLQAFKRLFAQLGLNPAELDRMVANLLLALDPREPEDATAVVPIVPVHTSQLQWLGLSTKTVHALMPFVTVLPTRTQVNLNTASAEVIAARIEGLDLSDARNLVSARGRTPFRTLADVTRILPAAVAKFNPSEVGVASRFFDVRGQLRLQDMEVVEHSLVQRNGISVTTVWRERAARDARTTAVAPR